VREVLELVSPLSEDFLIIVSKRFADVISKHLASEG